MAEQPPKTAVILKGWSHLTTSMSQTLPTQLHRAHVTRHAALNKLRRGKA